MKRLVAIALIAACSTEEPGVGFPIQPGGGVGIGGSSFADAAIDSGDASATITGRVCLLVTNLHTLTNCAATGADSLTVTLGTSTALTAADGTFSIMRPASTTDLSWSVTGAGIVASSVAFGPTTTLPAFDAAAYQQMISANNVVTSASDGAMIVRITRAGTLVAGATVDTVPAPLSDVYYDSGDDLSWNIGGGTGTNGVAWIPSIPGDSAQVTISSGGMDSMLAGNIPLPDNTIRFVFAEIP